MTDHDNIANKLSLWCRALFINGHAFSFFQALAMASCFMLGSGCSKTQQQSPGWPSVTRETKPWSRWWWHGSALTKPGITAEMEAYKQAGLGGLEITPIYGVYGIEEQFVEYLSPAWMELLTHTLQEAERLDLGIDMATGTGWPFGGPWVDDSLASKNLQYKTYTLTSGARLQEKITFVQRPYLRAVGSQLYEVHDSFSTEKSVAQGTRSEPVRRIDPKEIDMTTLKQPIAANKNLQALAIDQVVFERELPLQLLMAYSDSGQSLNITGQVDNTGHLDWVAPAGNWALYAVFEGSHGKMVERAGPGGEGYVIDHFSSAALAHYLSKFDTAFAGRDIGSLRAFFNDSYEVDDARGTADWSDEFLNTFRSHRGYDLEDHLPALLGKDTPENNNRVLCDYRETLSEMVLQNFTAPWKAWARGKDAIVRNQAHGSPSNILDLYATVDIPEIEGVEPLRIKMASSAGHVTGKRLVSSESATWLNEHFESNLWDIKGAVDRFMFHGVNHIFYHGTAYSPPDEPWPGRLFYAAVHLNPRNSLWNDFGALNAYVERCQSFLQASAPDNDILLYYPIYDRFSTPGPEMIEHFDGIGKQFDHTAFKRGAELLLTRGYAFDYISDKQLQQTTVFQGKIKTESGIAYKTIVVPHSRYIPLQTFAKIVALAEQGASVILLEGPPDGVSGNANYEKNRRSFEVLVRKVTDAKPVSQNVLAVAVGHGSVLLGDSLLPLLQHGGVRREAMVDRGIHYIRKKRDGGRDLYFVGNGRDTPFEGWLPLSTHAVSVVLFDPMRGTFGKALSRKSGDRVEVFVQLGRQETAILETYSTPVEVAAVRYVALAGQPVVLTGKWSVDFESGGPTLPAAVERESLSSWTTFGPEGFPAFSGTASYTLVFAKPNQEATRWRIDLGQVRESAEVFLNDKSLGTLIGPDYTVDIDASSLKAKNRLQVKVSNLMANRIADMDRRNIFWRKFYNVNFPARKVENRTHGLFDASRWDPHPSGLIGPVQLIPLAIPSENSLLQR